MGTNQVLRSSTLCLQSCKLSVEKRVRGLDVAGAIEAASNSETSTTQLVQDVTLRAQVCPCPCQTACDDVLLELNAQASAQTTPSVELGTDVGV